MTPHEEDVVMNWPRYVPLYTIAAGQASDAGNGTTGGGGEGKKGDAVRHSTWNCFIIRNVIIAGASESSAVNFAYQGTTAHEKNGSTGNLEYSKDIAMDLYNNLTGRTWMEDETGWGIGWARKMPSEPKIVNTMRIRADRAFKYNINNYENEIVYPAGGWSQLYGSATKGGHGELVYYND